MSVTNICAVTVNHNTSHFVELMLRSLFYTNDFSKLEFHITVLDNASNDAYLEQLEHYLGKEHIPFVQTGFDNLLAPEKHGAALERFVTTLKNCDYYLFLDSDIWFIEENTVATMLTELQQAPAAIFANQAKIYGYYADKIIEGNIEPDTLTRQLSFEGGNYSARSARRCSPVCSLVANTPTFQTIVKHIGLGRAVSFEVGWATYYDTFGLMTQVMATHGLDFMVSSKQINHFTMTSYDDEGRTIKDNNCLSMLAELRTNKGMKLDLFRKSDWARSQ